MRGQLVTYGNIYRRRGSTGVNAKSSRSHAVLQIDLRYTHEDDKLARSVLMRLVTIVSLTASLIITLLYFVHIGHLSV